MSTPRPTILLVDDDAHAVNAMEMALEGAFDCVIAASGPEALSVMARTPAQVVFCAQGLAGGSGIACLAEMRARWPDTVRVIVMDDTRATGDAGLVEAINEAGVTRCITAPWSADRLLGVARSAARLSRLSREHDRLSIECHPLPRSVQARLDHQRAALREGHGFENILRAPNSPMNPVVETARHFAGFDVPALITGEPGVGKVEIARAMHYASRRADRPFFELDCAGLDDAACEAELFGLRRGALDDRAPARPGLVEKADGGTLFLNGVDTLSPRLQLALSRLVRLGAFQPVGATETRTTNLRLLTGAQADLRAAVADGRFRTDLFYAISTAEIAVPPLRARRGDVALIARQLLREASRTHGKLAADITAPALDLLEGYDWPGNLRELGNEITRMLVRATGRSLGPELLSPHILQGAPGEESADRRAGALPGTDGSLRERVELVEMRILRETLIRLKWNKSRAAAELGLSRVGLRAKLDRYGIAPPATQES